jgi:hypothetical protein
MPEYQIRLSRPHGPLIFQHATICADDAEAATLARRLVAARMRSLHVEIWKDASCLYEGIPAGWPFVSRRTVVRTSDAPRPGKSRATYGLLQRNANDRGSLHASWRSHCDPGLGEVTV